MSEQDSLIAGGPRCFIQVFNRYLRPGGEESSVDRIALHLERAGHRVLRFWRSSDEWLQPNAPSRLKQPFLIWNNKTVLEELRKIHSDTKPDAWIVHNLLPVISLGIYRLGQELKVPVIQWLHNYRPLSPSGSMRAFGRTLRPEDPLLTLKETLAGTWRGPFLTAWLALGYFRARRRGDFASVAAWIAVSDEMRRIFQRGGLPASRLFTLRHSWDISTASPHSTDQGFFLFLGRMIEEKGVRFLIELWQRPELRNLQLVMAGDGPLMTKFQSKTPPNVRWAGYVKGKEKRDLIAGCRAVLFPCLWTEPLSTVAYEAYEQNKPMLSSALGGMTELVRDRETGRLLPPGDSEAWIEAIRGCAVDPAFSQALGRNGRRWLEENVSPLAWNRQFEQILQKVLTPSGFALR